MSLYLGASIKASTPPSTGSPRLPVIDICMFDCPEQTHTSPIITFSSVTGSPSLIRIV